jgi:hypothetical protein
MPMDECLAPGVILATDGEGMGGEVAEDTMSGLSTHIGRGVHPINGWDHLKSIRTRDSRGGPTITRGTVRCNGMDGAMDSNRAESNTVISNDTKIIIAIQIIMNIEGEICIAEGARGSNSCQSRRREPV